MHRVPSWLPWPQGCVNLTHVNVGSNKISSLAEVEKLSANPLLQSLTLAGNPVCDLEEYRMRVSFRLPLYVSRCWRWCCCCCCCRLLT